MKTVSLIACALVALYGFYLIVNYNAAGLPLILIGAISLLIISMRTEKIKQYDKDSFMNK